MALALTGTRTIQRKGKIRAKRVTLLWDLKRKTNPSSARIPLNRLRATIRRGVRGEFAGKLTQRPANNSAVMGQSSVGTFMTLYQFFTLSPFWRMVESSIALRV